MYTNLVDRFIKYAKINTRSDESSTTIPSTQSQVEFAKILMDDLKEIGLSDIEYNEKNGYVTATLPSNIDKKAPTVGFIAHMDTADFNAENINPQFHKNYDGKKIILNKEKNIILSPEDFPNMKNYIGQTLITTDGTTLLGSDDKSGIVEVISAVEYLLANPEIKHGDVRIAVGPDEEIGIGADLFDVEHFNAEFAYTVDGGPIGELEYESFNAASANITIQGKNVHPGTAKDTMINALKLAIELDSMLPENEVPEKTEDREGFYHLLGINGTVEEASMGYIIRDHSREKFNEKKEMIQSIAKQINNRFDQDRIKVEVKDQYYNMGEIIEKDMRSVEIADEAMRNINIEPDIKPIRGGTDGSKISFMGLPTPNLFAGGENFHGRYEFVSVESMVKATDVIVEIIKLTSIK
ncbi:peptidase T [Marinilactibacillus psychrotolerans]|uniref:Peptidase T n=2 Tax=Marinilactibacillus psychrotolerans TaxID=191770 RepID=A0A5R9C6G7_9LACT|nr:peptidase T [Marinilactibacillus psychrotolerans]TLQ08669.1 peptidase T [Marinilactibacillus psychrotolerans]GEQ32599.1 peptidase T [Marinilactibacillus psychrotolerans]SJN42044.1 Tripeptide aminopeptidase [Marinilactibacillus psychrotolerans 42ea]